MTSVARIVNRLRQAANEGSLGATVRAGISNRAAGLNRRCRDVYFRAGYAVACYVYDRGLRHAASMNRYPIPLPELGIERGNPVTAGKGATSWEKWRLIEANLPAGSKTAMDIGSNNGFFAIRLAQAGLFTLGVEPDIELLRLAQAAAIRADVRGVAFSSLPVSPENVSQLPPADVTVVMSVAHRWIRAHGRDIGDAMVKTIWEKTHRAMFFESPSAAQSTKERDILHYFGSTDGEAELNIIGWLNSLGGGKARLLGFLPSDFRPAEKRHLFVLERRGSPE
ncbi:MAG: hypothetical protein ABI442_02720 [Gemmatimonadaceae bacterium]